MTHKLMFASGWLILASWSFAASAEAFVEDPADLASLRADFSRRERELERSKIEALARFAATHPGEEADAAYDELFGLAMRRELYDAALPAALVRRDDVKADLPARAMALLVSVIAKADAGKYDESFGDLARFLGEHAAETADPNRPKLDEGTAIALGEAYLQRLFNARRYDVAGKFAALVQASVKRPGIQAHFAPRTARLAMIGKPAPAIIGEDVDGKPISLADFKGKVVLVDFWAAWCPPCLEELPRMMRLAEAHHGAGFTILGINLDAQHEDVGSVAKAKPIVRKLLVSAGISWPTLLAGAGPADPTAVYGVTAIPANFLIGKDGTIVGFELSGEALEKAVREELAK
ncbi:MAG: TlpA disulfide reductase family protein [Isosphaeraceae bacterium]|nr:TlpA disulfide reductase family protein [Isosphaeraceae bacterium]